MFHLTDLLPERGVMLRHSLPAGCSRTETVRCHLLLITVDPQFIIQRDPYRDRLTTQAFRHAVTVPANLDIAIPGDMTDVEVAGIEVRIRQRLQMRQFLREALFRCLLELAKLPPVGNVSHPLLQ